jgi:tRNA-intron endonuclease
MMQVPNDSSLSPLSEEKKSEFIVVDATYSEGKILLPDSEMSQNFFEKNYFGNISEKNGIKSLELETIEALLLLERNRIRIFNDSGTEITAEEILTQTAKFDERIWVKYLVYRDLRQRGYIVRMGYGNNIDFRVFPRGSTQKSGIAKYFVYILEEGHRIHLQNLDKITAQTLTARKILSLAIVDRLGDITYYLLEQLQFQPNTKTNKKQ